MAKAQPTSIQLEEILYSKVAKENLKKEAYQL